MIQKIYLKTALVRHFDWPHDQILTSYYNRTIIVLSLY